METKKRHTKKHTLKVSITDCFRILVLLKDRISLSCIFLKSKIGEVKVEEVDKKKTILNNIEIII